MRYASLPLHNAVAICCRHTLTHRRCMIAALRADFRRFAIDDAFIMLPLLRLLTQHFAD